MKLTDYTGDNIDRLITIEMRSWGAPEKDRARSRRGTTVGIYDAARSKLGRPLTLLAAESLMKEVKANDVVIITAGFFPDPVWLPRGEHDGPPGAVALARSINIGLNASIAFFTEEAGIPIIEAACRGAGIRTLNIDLFKKAREVDAVWPGFPATVQQFPIDIEEAKKEAKKVIEELDPSAIIALEKCGRNEYGVWHSGRGNDMSATTAKVDYLFDEARERGILTVGFIDVGNEIGSGLIKETVKKIIPLGAKCNCPCGGGIACEVETDFVVVSSNCNWGAYGVIACLAGLLDDSRVFHTHEIEKRIFDECIRAGSLDAATLAPSFALSGVPLEEYQHLIELCRAIVNRARIVFRPQSLRR